MGSAVAGNNKQSTLTAQQKIKVQVQRQMLNNLTLKRKGLIFILN